LRLFLSRAEVPERRQELFDRFHCFASSVGVIPYSGSPLDIGVIKAERLASFTVHEYSGLALFEEAASGADLGVRNFMHWAERVIEAMVRSGIFRQLRILSQLLEPLDVITAGCHGHPIVRASMKHTDRSAAYVIASM
jgi:hypothetical protein